MEWGSDMASRRAVQRLIYRCVSEYLLSQAGVLAARHDGDFVRAVIYLALVQASAGRSDDDGAISVRGLSRSLALAFETTRRKVIELEAAGLCRRLADQRLLALAPADDDLRAEIDRIAAGFQALMARMTRLGIGPGQFLGPLPTPAADQAQARVATHRLVQGFILRALEAGVEPQGSIVNTVLYAALVSANASRITNDPVLAIRYAGADTPPPDSIRSPAKPAELAERLGLPYELVRRRLLTFGELGWARRVEAGYLANIERMDDPALMASTLAIGQRFAQLVQGVAQTGLDLSVGETD
jgi:hypothetical protein